MSLARKVEIARELKKRERLNKLDYYDPYPFHCKKFSTCNAPICPLDPDWAKRAMIRNEGICYYLKDAVRGRFSCTYPEQWDSGVVGPILDKHPHIGSRILR